MLLPEEVLDGGFQVVAPELFSRSADFRIGFGGKCRFTNQQKLVEQPRHPLPRDFIGHVDNALRY